MNRNKELNSRLFAQWEEQQNHDDFAHEYGFYEAIAAGDMEAVRKRLANPEDVTLYERPEYGRLSKDALRNIRYHFVVSVALITRTCVGKGLERELAYTLSDLYINEMDNKTTAQQILSLLNEMILDFAGKMADLPKQQVYSMQVVKAMEYVCRNLNERITVQTVADILQINRSYLSTLFKKEAGISLSAFIRREKLKAAAGMLKFSELPYSDIAEYFGFSSQSHFISCFKKETGLLPKEYRKRFARSQGDY